MTFDLYIAITSISGLLAVALAIFFWRRRSAPGATTMAVMMLAVLLWLLTKAHETIGTTIDAHRLAENTMYLSIVSAPVIWFLFTAQYTRSALWLRTRWYLLAVVPAITMLLVWTDGFHGLMWHNLRLVQPGDFYVLVKDYGSWFWVHAGYSYIIILAGFVLILARLHPVQLYRNQIRILVAAALVPLATNIQFVFWPELSSQVDMTPAAFIFSAALIAIGLFWLQVLNLAPIARNRVLEDLDDGIIVIDYGGRFLDLNPAAGRALGFPVSSLIGKPVAILQQRFPELGHFLAGRGGDSPMVMTSPVNGNIYEVNRRAVYDDRQQLMGWVVTLLEVTRLKKSEEELRRLSQRIIHLQDEERAGISRELHDQVGQHLALLALTLSKAKQGADTEVATKLEEAQGQLRRITIDVRNLAASLYPSMLQNLGLMQTLVWYLSEFTSRTGINVIFHQSGLEDIDLSPEVRLTAYRIVQESLTNVMKHSEAQQASVRVHANTTGMDLDIEDPGKGFDPGSIPISSSGVAGMRARAESVGGSLSVESKPGQGTIVNAKLPVQGVHSSSAK